MQFNASVQRALGDSWDVVAGYVGSRGHNLIRLGDANLAPETIVNGVKTYQPQLGRRNPLFTGIWQRMTDAKSFYDSLQLSLNRRYSSGWRAQVSYTLSEATDDASGINSQDFSNNVQYVSDWYDLEHDRGLSAFHARHNLTANASWDLPFFAGRGGVAGALLSGWQVNGIATLRSGHPFSIELGFNRSGQSEHDRVFAPRASGLEAGMLGQPGARRTGSLLGRELLPVASGEHTRQSRTQHGHRP